jgi:uncharacterized protein (TIGR02266 family)
MGNGKNNRRHTRIEIILKVAYDTSEGFLADYAKNASHGGIFIATNRNFNVGDKISFDISFPGLLEPIRCHGEVRWQRAPIKATEDKPAGIGVAFEFKSEEQRRQIDELVKKLNQEAPEELPEEAPFRVLVAEDNPLVREMLRFGVRKFHRTGPAAGRELEVIEAENGQEAWEHIKEGAADLAIIDYYMPIMNGAQLIRKIRETESLQSLPVIVVSVGGEEARQDSYAAGADLFLDKPVLLGQLFASLRRLLGLQQQAGG